VLPACVQLAVGGARDLPAAAKAPRSLHRHQMAPILLLLEADPHIENFAITSAPVRRCFDGFTVVKLPPPARAMGSRSWTRSGKTVTVYIYRRVFGARF